MKMTFKTIFFGGLLVFFAVVIAVVFIPDLLWKPPQTTIAHTYTDEQALGRKLFYSNGCNYCHTQYVRDEDTGMGVLSQGGNYVFDNPMTLGSERTGPDLSYVGRKRSFEWEIQHLKHPRDLSPLSIMPNWYFLSDTDLHAIATYLFSLGDRVAQERMVLPSVNYAGKTDPIAYPAQVSAPADTPQGWDAWIASDLQAGKEIYIKNCQTCHGCAGNGLGSYAGTAISTPVNYKQNPYRNMPDDQWFWHVSEGVQGSFMPTWKTSLTEDQRWEVIRYIQQIFARPVMRDPNEGDPTGQYVGVTNPLPPSVDILEQGKAIFTRECSVCHGTTGRGDGIYHEDLQPSPPDFGSGNYGTLADPSYTDADYFWRISEGLPWASMPVWKDQYSEEDRWSLVYYIRVNFTQTLPLAPAVAQPDPPAVYTDQTMPETASFENGKMLYSTTCAMCHGLAGDGNGWTGSYLGVQPSALTGQNVANYSDGVYFSKITFGKWNTSMPIFAEFLPDIQRWDIVKYIKTAFRDGTGQSNASYSNNDAIATNFLTLSIDDWTGEGHIVSTDDGKTSYATYCAGCHGDALDGKGKGAVTMPGGTPAAFGKPADQTYLFWRTWDGIPGTVMPSFNWIITETDVWDITSYMVTVLGSK